MQFVWEKSDVSYTKARSGWPVRVLISFAAYFDMVLTNNHFFPVTKAYNHSQSLSLSPSDCMISSLRQCVFLDSWVHTI